MPKSNYLATALIGHVFAKSTYTPPAHYYIALCKIAPLASDTGSTITESTYTSYARVLKNTADFTAVSANAVSNVAEIDFPVPGASGDTVYGFAVLDAATLGNVLYFGPLAALPVTPGFAPFLPAGALVLGES